MSLELTFIELAKEASRLGVLMEECRLAIKNYGIGAVIAQRKPLEVDLKAFRLDEAVSVYKGYASLVMADAAERLAQIAEQKIELSERRPSPPSPVLSAEASEASTPLRECWVKFTEMGTAVDLTNYLPDQYPQVEGYPWIHMREVGADRGGSSMTDRQAGYFCAQLVQALYQEGGALYKGSGGELAMAKRLMDSLDAERPTGSPAAPALDWTDPGRRLTETELDEAELCYSGTRRGRNGDFTTVRAALEAVIRNFLSRSRARASLASPPPLSTYLDLIGAKEIQIQENRRQNEEAERLARTKTGGVKPDGLRPQIRDAVQDILVRNFNHIVSVGESGWGQIDLGAVTLEILALLSAEAPDASTSPPTPKTGEAVEKWHPDREVLPQPQKSVLTYDPNWGMSVRYYVPPDGVHAWGWYPGGRSVGGIWWRELPEKPALSGEASEPSKPSPPSPIPFPNAVKVLEWLDFALPQVGGHPLDSVVHSEWLAAGRPYPVSDWVCREVAGKLRALLSGEASEPSTSPPSPVLPPLRWTKEKPKVEGNYHHRIAGDSHSGISRLRTISGQVYWWDNQEREWFEMADGCEYAGPIPEPQAAPDGSAPSPRGEDK